MNKFTKGFLFTMAVIWIVPALISWNYLNLGPALAFIHSNGSWFVLLLVGVGLPFLGGLANNGWRLKQQ